eukprot:11045821-Alexandrium_andersonii.AAC.1
MPGLRQAGRSSKGPTLGMRRHSDAIPGSGARTPNSEVVRLRQSGGRQQSKLGGANTEPERSSARLEVLDAGTELASLRGSELELESKVAQHVDQLPEGALSPGGP